MGEGEGDAWGPAGERARPRPVRGSRRAAKGDATAVRTSQRRKDERPAQIVAAAFEEFAEKGFAGTRLEDVAARARVSKGLPYLYFKTKEELFKAVLRSVLKPRFDALFAAIHATSLSSEAFLRGPFLAFLQGFVRSRKAAVARLMIAEGPKHPELTAYWCEEVIARGIEALQLLIDRGVQRGEFRPTPLRDFPQLMVAPALLAILWRALFERHRHLDTDALLAAHVELLLAAIKAPAAGGEPLDGVAQEAERS